MRISLFCILYFLIEEITNVWATLHGCGHHKLEENTNLIYILLSAFGLFFFLILLGVFKGLLGLCAAPIGIFGLQLLIDLPISIDRYVEKDLKQYSVQYDTGGWPVHPETQERTVRVLPLQMEFCLNVIFFVAFPICFVIYLCGLCCGVRNCSLSDNEVCFERVDVIKYINQENEEVRSYKDSEKDEDGDTEYVRTVIKKSTETLYTPKRIP